MRTSAAAPTLATVVALPEVQEARRSVELLKSFTVTDAASLVKADEILGLLKARIDRLHEIFDPICQAADKAHKQAVGARAEQIDPLVRLRQQVSTSAAIWHREQEEKRLEEERRLQDEARRQEEAQRLAAAAQAEAEGQPELAAAILEDPAPPPTVIVPRTTPKLTHTSFTTRYVARVANKMVLVKAVADGRVPLVAVDENMSYLNSRARQEKTALSIPGVEAIPEPGTRVRS